LSISSLILKTIESAKTELIHPVMDYINDENEYRQFVFTILFKLANGLETVNLLNTKLINKPQYLDTIFISLRALLADKITMDYLLFKSELKNENLNEKLEWLKRDHIQYALSNLQIYKSIYGADDKEIKRQRNKLISGFPRHFHKNGSLKKQDHKLPSIGWMTEKIIKGTIKNSSFQRQLILSYEHYDIFSKYEHLGQLTPYLVFRGYKDSKQESITSEIQTCLRILIDFMADLTTEFHETEFIENTNYWKFYEQLNGELS
jgi:hypothetical protein